MLKVPEGATHITVSPPDPDPARRRWVIHSRRYAGLVERYHVWPLHRKQTVAEHSWQVACIYEELFGPPPAHVERYIRYHDIAEVQTGDVPYPVKALAPEVKEAYDRLEAIALGDMGITLPDLTPEEKARVKVADWLDLTEMGMEDRERGNKLATPIIRHTESSIRNLAAEKLSHEDNIKIIMYLTRLWHRHNEIMREG